MSRAISLILVLAAVGALASGCGEPTVYRTDRPILRLKLDEYRIVPQNIEVKAGRMKFTATNTGKLTHNLVIQVPDGPDGKPVDLPGGRMATMHPGQSAPPIKVTLAPGKYLLVCTIANHDDLGQYGTLTVRK